MREPTREPRRGLAIRAMVPSGLGLHGLMLCALSLGVLGAGPVAAQDPMQAVEREVARLVPPGAVRDLTLCKLQDGVWGGYDVRVHVTMATDGLPWLFELVDGQFRGGVDPAPRGGSRARFDRDGRVQPASAAEAFARGIPFFIVEAVVEEPGVLRLAVLSNPTATDASALVLALIDERVESPDVQSVTLPIDASAEPQIIRLTNEAFGRAPGTVRVAILRGAGRLATVVGCIVSNELDVSLGSP